MPKINKILLSVLSGVSDNNIQFSELCSLLEALGFFCRVKGSHHIYYKENIAEIINIQPIGNKAKAYQVKQIRSILLRYKLGGTLNA